MAPTRTCLVAGCASEPLCRGLCQRHGKSWRRHPTEPVEEFAARARPLLRQADCLVAGCCASTTALYTSVSASYRSQTLRTMLDKTIADAHACNGQGDLMARRPDGPQDQLPLELRQLMAAHDLWKTTELIPLLAERGVRLSATQV